MRHAVFTLGLVLACCSSVFAWSRPGHMVTAAIAYDLMSKEHPVELAKLLETIRQHPQYPGMFERRLNDIPAENRDRYLFMLVARWADDIRQNERFHRGPWHYISWSLVAPADVETLHPPEAANENILSALASNLKIAVEDPDARERAVAVCWVFHLTGDIHQPLHACTFFSHPQWPNGDRGGNDFYVRPREGSDVINLHAFWDGLIIGSDRYQDLANRAIELRLRPEFAKEKLTELADGEIEHWARESAKFAKEIAYQHGTLQGSNNRNEGPVLPAGYVESAKSVAERRAVLAGYRLAEALVKIGAASPATQPTTVPSVSP